jgi:RNA polymerase subunit RPABC4/transcription elongation factor Spt4
MLDPNKRYLKALFTTTLYVVKHTLTLTSPVLTTEFINSVTEKICPSETLLEDTGKLLIVNNTENKQIAKYILVKTNTDEAYVQIWASSSTPVVITVGRVY